MYLDSRTDPFAAGKTNFIQPCQHAGLFCTARPELKLKLARSQEMMIDG
jgi:hypothetical protein